MSLNPRQRTKVNAALSLIALHGHNPRTIQQAAKAHIAKGTPEADAYSAALNAFTANVPAMRETLGTILELVQHSDEATLGKYDAAISRFNKTGDNSALTALEPMIVDDFKALIVKTGQATAEEAAALAFNISDALAFSDEAVSPEPWQPTAADIDPQAPQEAAQEAAAKLPADHRAYGAQEGNTTMTALNPRQYADAVRDLRGRLGGKPIDGHPEYAALQARLIGNAPAAGPAAPVIRDGQATIPGQFTATGYRPPLTGERARSWAGTPLGDAGQ